MMITWPHPRLLFDRCPAQNSRKRSPEHHLRKTLRFADDARTLAIMCAMGTPQLLAAAALAAMQKSPIAIRKLGLLKEILFIISTISEDIRMVYL